METILAIEEVEDRLYQPYVSGDGYRIQTTEQEILCLIDNNQYCCEDWGYLISEDNFSPFIGATLLSIYVTDLALEKVNFTENLYDGGAVFINFATSVGVLQFVAYNSHNGYYGHSVILQSNQLELEEVI